MCVCGEGVSNCLLLRHIRILKTRVKGGRRSKSHVSAGDMGRYVHFISWQHTRCGTSDMKRTPFVLSSAQSSSEAVPVTYTYKGSEY